MSGVLTQLFSRHISISWTLPNFPHPRNYLNEAEIEYICAAQSELRTTMRLDVVVRGKEAAPLSAISTKTLPIYFCLIISYPLTLGCPRKGFQAKQRSPAACRNFGPVIRSGTGRLFCENRCFGLFRWAYCSSSRALVTDGSCHDVHADELLKPSSDYDLLTRSFSSSTSPSLTPVVFNAADHELDSPPPRISCSLESGCSAGH